MRAVHVPALVAVEGAQLRAVVDEGARDGGRVGAAPLQLGEEHARVEVVQLLQVAEDGRRGLGGHAQLVPATREWVVLLPGTISHHARRPLQMKRIDGATYARVPTDFL